MCQDYPPVLEDLTPVEECMIVRCHPFEAILKLRPYGFLSRQLQCTTKPFYRHFTRPWTVTSDSSRSEVKIE